MRNTLLSATILLCAVTAHSRQISYEEAYAIGSDFIRQESPSKTISRSERSQEDVSDKTFYIFNAVDGNGFVVVAGETRAKSILAYSPTGSLDSAMMPPQLVSMLNQYHRQISALKPDSDKSVPKAHKRIAGASKVLPTAKFHQGAPYNLLTPVIDGMHCATGCVATSMAIIMKYHNWPDKEMGYEYYDNNLQTVQYDFSAEFDWDNILDDYTGETTERQQLAVAKVMSEAGIAMASQYTPYETGAYTTTLGYAMLRIFRFHPAQKHVLWKHYVGDEAVENYYSDEDWYAMIVNEIDNNRPVLYGAGSYSEMRGHNFVIDGYDSDNMFHINWGWGGDFDGFFALSALLPTDDYESAFPDMHEMWIGLMPEEHRPGQTSKVYFGHGSNLGLTYAAAAVKTGVPVGIRLKGLCCRLPDMGGEVGVSLKNEKREVVETVPLVTPLKSFVINSGATEEIVFHTPGIAADWQMQAVYRENGGDWIEIPGSFGNDHCPTVQSGATIDMDVEDGLQVSIRDVGNGYAMVTPDMDGKLLPGSYEVRLDITHDSRYHLVIDGMEEGRVSYAIPILDYLPDAEPTYYIVAGFEVTPESTHSVRAYSIPHSALENAEITVDTPGMLSGELTGYDLAGIGSLKVSGTMNYSDFDWIGCNLPNLHTLDTSGVEFERSGYQTRRTGFDQSLQNLRLPANVVRIEYASIMNTSCLKTLHIPASVTSVSAHAVESHMLRDVYVYNPVPPAYDGDVEPGVSMFLCNSPEKMTVHVPYGSKSAYEQTEHWTRFGAIVEFDPLAGIGHVVTDGTADDICDVFTVQGLCLKRGATPADIDGLAAGIYLLHYPGDVRKIVKRR